MSQNADLDFENLLEFLRDERGFDFTGYKRASLLRRTKKRMGEVQISDYESYLDFLKVHPAEFIPLFNTILINITSFFRDEMVWEFIREKVVPELLKRKEKDDFIRIWSAGCASGEEPFTMGMILAEILDPEDFQQRVKIYATDVDEEALAQARQATYTSNEIKGVPSNLLDKYFTKGKKTFSVTPMLRHAVIFGRHDLTKDAPISHLDLLICRNTLMYLNRENQQMISDRFAFALDKKGYLILGKAETLMFVKDTFRPTHFQNRIYIKETQTNHSREHLQEYLKRSNDEHMDLIAKVFEIGPVPQIVIRTDGRLILANRQAREIFDLEQDVIGRNFGDLKLSYRPIELRLLIDSVLQTKEGLEVKEVEFQSSEREQLIFNVQLKPITNKGESLKGVSIIFLDVTQDKQVCWELQKTNEELKAAYEELQTTNEELETTNEELHSTIEEVETTNEELQSTNEELETMNEELHSTNDELRATNLDLQVRTNQLNEADAFRKSILTNLKTAVITADTKMSITSWNKEAENLWGLREDEIIGENLLGLDIGFPIETLKNSIQDCLAGKTDNIETTNDAIDRRGHSIRCHVICRPLSGHESHHNGVIIMMENTPDDK